MVLFKQINFTRKKNAKQNCSNRLWPTNGQIFAPHLIQYLTTILSNTYNLKLKFHWNTSVKMSIYLKWILLCCKIGIFTIGHFNIDIKCMKIRSMHKQPNYIRNFTLICATYKRAHACTHTHTHTWNYFGFSENYRREKPQNYSISQNHGKVF